MHDDHVNLGDDLFIETIVNRYPDTGIFIFGQTMKIKKYFKNR